MNLDLSRPDSMDYINRIFKDFMAFSGDRLYGEDPSLVGGIARLGEVPVTVIAQLRGKTVVEARKVNYSMTKPEGFRKSLRLMKQAEKFNRPVICFVDTLGAYPGEQAEERGQATAIANNLMKMSTLQTLIFSIIIGNGGSGGALALCVADEIAMLEKACFGVILPKGCATILWKDGSREEEAAQMLKMTSSHLIDYHAIDAVIPEGTIEMTAGNIEKYLKRQITARSKKSKEYLVKKRQERFRDFGSVYLYGDKLTGEK